MRRLPPLRTLCAWLLLGLAFAVLSANTPAPPMPAEKDTREFGKLIDKMGRSLKASPVELDRALIRPGEDFGARAFLVNHGAADLAMPPDPWRPAEKGLYSGSWYVRRLDGRGKFGKESNVSNDNRMPAEVIKAGERLECRCRFDPFVWNLESGDYEMIVKFADGKWGTSRAVFRVENPGHVPDSQLRRDTERQKEADAAMMRSFLSGVTLQPLQLSARSVKAGADVDATSGLVNAGRTALSAPGESALLSVDWYLDDGTPMVEGLRRVYRHEDLDLNSRKLEPGASIPLRVQVSGADLKPGNYELILEVKDSSGRSLPSRRAKLRVTR